ncbi:neuroendocrine convertase 1 [Cephus cinctus]|uniref:furin n=1 Tax=Cephus cinctus TaxID=211228 RepID=A0AAJ7FMD8_CEPCN|nr:neuroendocrine convertase 1 [Cephus cinctus]
MARSWCRLLTWILGLTTCVSRGAANESQNLDYQNEWVVRVKGGSHVASLLAIQSGYRHLGPVLGFKDTYLWTKDYGPSQRKRAGPGVDPGWSTKLLWAEQQKTFKRHKRDFLALNDPDSEKPLLREKRLPPETEMIMGPGKNSEREKRSAEETESSSMFDDELWEQEWYLQDTRASKSLPKLDLNVLPLYRLGVTGRGIRVAVLDDGLEYTHEDLRNNYDPEISYDVNEADSDPIPRYESTGMNGHGTRCAGEIAMEANNHKCGVGVAFGASVGGVKLLDGVVNDRVEGEALGFRTDLVDIYTASWGPADDGRSLEAPGRLATEALERGVREGRAGKGSIYVWASGNGGSNSDDCGCDGYVGSIYTVAVGSASQMGRFPWYGERCPATLATTYSSGAYHDQMIATTDLKNSCTTRHTGTSASAPLAAGIIALALEVNDNLTWRDVQHLIVWTSEYSPLRDNPGWLRNDAGFWFNPRFGFGLMNAHALVMAGFNWTRVPDKEICRIEPSFLSNANLRYGTPVSLEFEANACEGEGRMIEFLEHVQLEVSLNYSIRGALSMHLTAPSGLEVQILRARKLDESPAGFAKWRFLSVASWGERPEGTWTLRISDEVGPPENNGTLGDFALILHGTRDLPDYRSKGSRVYDDDYNRIRKTNKVDLLDDKEIRDVDEKDDWRLANRIMGSFEGNWIKRLLFAN